jgi:hypothetical protein
VRCSGWPISSTAGSRSPRPPRCDLTIAEAKAELDRLAAAQVAQIQVTQNGVLVYVFPGFLSDEEKARAQDF